MTAALAGLKVLGWLGFSPAEQDALRSSGVI